MSSSRQPVVFWDFDGTLGGRRAGHWGACLIALLDRDDPGHGITREMLAPHLNAGFPWHDHHVGHEDLSKPHLWWEHVSGVLRAVLGRAGYAERQAARLMPGFRDLYLDPDGWAALPDAQEALQTTADAGWRNIIVSNHAPELESIVDAVGLAGMVDAVVSSATVGYEKPHRKIFEAALAAAGAPSRTWMVGDNPIADIAGAAKLGIPGVLVRAPEFTPAYLTRMNEAYGSEGWTNWADQVRFRAEDAKAAALLLLSESARAKGGRGLW